MAWTPGGDEGKADEKAPILESLRLVRGNRYLLLIALAIFVSTLAGTLVKYQFKAVAQIHFAGDRDALTSFAGYFYGYIAVFSFIFHTLMTGRLLRWIGLGGCLFILPLSLSVGMGALAFSATLAAGGALTSWLTFAADTRQFSGTPDNSDVGTIQIRVTATDDEAPAVSATFALEVANVNDAPVVVSDIGAQTATEDAAFDLDVSGNFTDEIGRAHV